MRSRASCRIHRGTVDSFVFFSFHQFFFSRFPTFFLTLEHHELPHFYTTAEGDATESAHFFLTPLLKLSHLRICSFPTLYLPHSEPVSLLFRVFEASQATSLIPFSTRHQSRFCGEVGIGETPILTGSHKLCPQNSFSCHGIPVDSAPLLPPPTLPLLLLTRDISCVLRSTSLWKETFTPMSRPPFPKASPEKGSFTFTFPFRGLSCCPRLTPLRSPSRFDALPDHPAASSITFSVTFSHDSTLHISPHSCSFRPPPPIP